MADEFTEMTEYDSEPINHPSERRRPERSIIRYPNMKPGDKFKIVGSGTVNGGNPFSINLHRYTQTDAVSPGNKLKVKITVQVMEVPDTDE